MTDKTIRNCSTEFLKLANKQFQGSDNFENNGIYTNYECVGKFDPQMFADVGFAFTPKSIALTLPNSEGEYEVPSEIILIDKFDFRV